LEEGIGDDQVAGAATVVSDVSDGGGGVDADSGEDEEDHQDEDTMQLHDGVKRWYTLDCGGQLQASVLLCVPVTAANIRLGLRVERGPHWTHGDQDGGQHSLGTVVGYSLPADDDPNRKMKYGVSTSSMPVLHAVVKWDRPPANRAAAAIARLDAPLPNEAAVAEPEVTGGDGGDGTTRSATGCRAHYPIGSFSSDTGIVAVGADGRRSSSASRRSSAGSALSPMNASSSTGSEGGAGAPVYALSIPNRGSGGKGETADEEALAAATVKLERSILLEKQRAAEELQAVRKEAQGWLKQNKRLSQLGEKERKEAIGRLKKEENRVAEAKLQLARGQRGEKERQRTEKRKQDKALQSERQERQALEAKLTEGERMSREQRREERKVWGAEKKTFEKQQQEQHRQLRTLQGQLRDAKQEVQVS
jgi:hypothetical protein